uniref:Uncharacterized protein n=1 Tax=Spironucleus salmonicida TaxID=348837 RepID=V6LII8_9EUKA|eukprot:EST44357.1 Hypothetical protein SS50377_15785 [Spironucleus salmonicida]
MLQKLKTVQFIYNLTKICHTQLDYQLDLLYRIYISIFASMQDILHLSDLETSNNSYETEPILGIPSLYSKLTCSNSSILHSKTVRISDGILFTGLIVNTVAIMYLLLQWSVPHGQLHQN